MADVYMHAKLAKEIINWQKNDLIKELVVTGAQGPDPMYYGFFHQYGDRYHFFADRMHDTDTSLLFETMFSYAKKYPSKEVYSYLIGFLCHFALDVKIHPYVYYHVGQYDKSDPKTHNMRGLHLKFERSIDACLIEHDLSIKAHRYAIQKETFPLKNIPTEIKDFYQNIMNERYKFPDGALMIKNSVRTMYRVLKYIVRDRTGLKKFSYKLLDKIFSEEDMYFSDLSMYHHTAGFDFLNQEKRLWKHPVTNESFNKTVFDLYQEAFIFAKELIDYLDQYLEGKEPKSVARVIGNLSFNSGVDCDEPRPMKHYNIYVK